jgi:hypothetical protein
MVPGCRHSYSRFSIQGLLIFILSYLACSRSIHFCVDDHTSTCNFFRTETKRRLQGISFQTHSSVFPYFRDCKVKCSNKIQSSHEGQNTSANIKFHDESPSLRNLNRVQLGSRMFPNHNATSSVGLRPLSAPAGSFFFRLKKSAEQVRTSFSSQRNEKIFVNSSKDLDSLVKQGLHVSELEIRGRSQPWRQNERGALLSNSSGGIVDGRKSQLKHSVLEAIWQRARSGSKPGQRADNFKIGLAIEGIRQKNYHALLTFFSSILTNICLHLCFMSKFFVSGESKAVDCADALPREWRVQLCIWVCLMHLM